MAPPGGSVGAGSGGEEDAKHMFDRIGEEVYKEVKNGGAEKYFYELHGTLSKARFENEPEGLQTQGNPCQLDHRYHTNATNVRSYPCRAGKEERFSQVHGGECDKNKIRDNEDDRVGACAPFRRLHLCVRNLENINIKKKIDNDNLLADVCLAAKYEGDLIKTHYTPYEHKYGDSPSQLCTMLARSFADIGDIVRGKDLYLGNSREKEKLQTNLKSIFQNIYKNLKKPAQKHYSDPHANFYKLREDWWYANRQQVWYAITCGAEGYQYFRKTACNGGKSSTPNKCRCTTHDVPTYFDYVPQYLRWFEEWAEDFCRKRKKQLTDAIKNCREEDENGENRYCDLNGYDCKNTAKGKNKYKHDQECIKCSSVCIPFGPWIKNQKQEFEKQKNKYENEILGKSRRKRSIGSDTYDGYIEQFYDILKREYRDVDKFLDLLSKETACKQQPYDEPRTIDISFKNPEGIDIFSSTKYCQACPWCGIEEQKVNGRWIAKGDEDCNNKEIIKFNNEDTTDISILSTDRGKTKILEKLGSFCRNGEKIKKDDWKCHYDDNDKSDNCILQNDNKNTKNQEIESFNSLFWHWINEMLKDSILWSKELDRCIKKDDKSKCISGCKKNCECFKNWVAQKQQEWKQIEQHYEKEDFELSGPYGILEGNLQIYYLPMIQEAHPKDEAVQKMEDIIEKNKPNMLSVKEHDNSITKFLQHEEEDANKCTGIHNDAKCNQQKKQKTPGGGDDARSDTSHDGARPQPPPITNHHEEHDDDEDDDPNKIRSIKFEDEKHIQPKFKEHPDEVKETEEAEETEEGTDGGGEIPQKETQPAEATTEDGTGETTQITKEDGVKPCDIVSKLFQNPNDFSDACTLKYVTGKNYGWKCIPSGDKTATSSGNGERPSRSKRGAEPTSDGVPTTGGKDGATGGSICVPPRRRRLYVTPLTRLAGGDGNTQAGETTQGNGASTETPEASLRRAFVESAAVETFFLWHKYKEEKKTPATQNGALPLPLAPDVSPPSENPQTKLEGGNIPEEFLRQMFYTLGDYRDILVRGGDVNSDSEKKDGDSNSDRNIVLNAGGDKASMEKIQQEIDEIIKQSGNNKGTSGTTSRGPQIGSHSPNPDKQQTEREKWWDKHAPSIWNGMICALTYEEKTNSASGSESKIEQNQKLKDKLWDNDGNKPKNDNYTYDKVELKEENSGPKGQTESSSPSGDNTPLSHFISRPTYFRYLEEWGQNFCKERKKRLEKIKEECRSGNYGKEHCSGDGHYCKTSDLKHHKMFQDFVCRDCYKQCRKYKKWIDIKFDEYQNQKHKYQGEYDKLTKVDCPNNGDKKFCEEIKKHSSAAEFLKSLKHCKDGQNNNDQNNIIDFENTKTTFGPLDYCKTCPLNGVNCNVIRGTNGCIENRQKWKDVFDKIHKDNEKITENITVEMIDRRGINIDKKFEQLFKESYLFKSVREQNWECKVINNDTDVCKLTNFDETIDLNDYTTFKVFLEYWLDDFLYGYYLLKKRKIIEKCTQKEGKTCNENSKNDCACVGKWVQQKGKEWESIKDHFQKRQYGNGDDIKSKVKMFLEKLQSLTELNKIMKPCTSLDKFKASLKCNSTENSEKGGKDGKKSDIIECMLEDLDTKIKTGSCLTQPSGEKQAECEKYTPPDDEDLLLEEENENQVEAPKICEGVIKPETKVVDEHACKTDAPQPDVKEEEEEKEEEIVQPATTGDEGTKELPLTPPAPAPAAPSSTPATPNHQPLPSDNTSDILKTTIPF
ncbi:hypothetical protein PFNF54_01767, partial [Plasmodium falciparum NF54]